MHAAGLGRKILLGSHEKTPKRRPAALLNWWKRDVKVAWGEHGYGPFHDVRIELEALIV